MNQMSSKPMRELTSKKKVPRTSDRERDSRAGGQEGGKGGVNLPPGGRKEGRKEEKKIGRKKERRRRRFEDYEI